MAARIEHLVTSGTFSLDGQTFAVDNNIWVLGDDTECIVIDAVGRPETYRQAFDARDLAGTVVLVGVPTPQMQLEMPLIEFFGHGGALKSSWYGDCLPKRDFPLLIDLFLQGRFALDAFVSERIALDDVEEAFHRMEKGEVLRSVVVLEARAEGTVL